MNNFAKTEDKDFYIKDYNLNKSIYNITEEGKIIEKKLINKEKKKYFSGFKNKYNGLMRKNKKVLIDINEYINGKGGKKNNMRNNLINKYKIVKIGSVLKQIDRKIKKINQKEKMKDIIQDIKRFKEKEIIIQDRFRKTDEKFNNLINNKIETKPENQINKETKEIKDISKLTNISLTNNRKNSYKDKNTVNISSNKIEPKKEKNNEIEINNLKDETKNSEKKEIKENIIKPEKEIIFKKKKKMII